MTCSIEHVAMDLPDPDFPKEVYQSHVPHIVTFEASYKDEKDLLHIPAEIISQARALKSLLLLHARPRRESLTILGRSLAETPLPPGVS